MKKLYTMLLAATVAISAVAANTLESASTTKVMPGKTATKVNKLSKASDIRLLDETTPDLSIESLAGEYDWSFYNYLNGTSGGAKQAAVTITIVDATTGKVNMDMAGWLLEATYDATTAKLSLPTGQDLGYNEVNQIEVYNYHRVWSSDGQSASFTDDPIVMTFDGEDILFAETEGTGDMAGSTILCDMIGIGNSSLGWFLMAGDNKITAKTPFEDIMPEGEWKSIGTGTFTDGWQVAAYAGSDYEKYPWDVEVEQNQTNLNLFRIVHPYTVSACPISSYNSETELCGYIVFDAEDPDFIVVQPFIYSGLTDDKGAYLNYNLEGYATVIIGATKEFVKENKDELEIEYFSSYSNGLVIFENLCFGTKSEPEASYQWQDNSGKLLDFPSYLEIKLPSTTGIANVEVDANTPVEYFNLQGVRVANPEAGLYIKRQGNKATKVIVK